MNASFADAGRKSHILLCVFWAVFNVVASLACAIFQNFHSSSGLSIDNGERGFFHVGKVRVVGDNGCQLHVTREMDFLVLMLNDCASSFFEPGITLLLVFVRKIFK